MVGWGAIAKRIFDVAVSVVLLVPIVPIIIVLSLLQKIFAPGPIFYVSKWLSQFSKPVNLVKFRTMGAQYGKKDASLEFEDMGRPDLASEYRKNHKVVNDPRITGIGKFLRETSLDELPQIFNVLRGDLSLVGDHLSCLKKSTSTRTAPHYSTVSKVA